MAASRVSSARWLRRYIPFFIIGIVILVVQLFLGYCFYLSSSSNEEDFRVLGTPRRKPGYSQVGNREQSAQQEPRENQFPDDYDESIGNSLDRNTPKSIKGHKIKVPAPSKDSATLNSQPSSNNNQVNNSKNSGPPLELNLDELDFHPWCTILSRDAISAIHRASTQQCKQEIANITCLIQEGKLYPKQLPRYCSIRDANKGEYLGCYQDDNKNRLLPSLTAKTNENSPSRCVDICIRYGFQVAGTQFGAQCFCGRTVPSKSFRIDGSKCNMVCPKNATLHCGGYLTMDVYKTGLKPVKHEPLPIDALNRREPAKIVFLLTINGRAVRQVRRLIKVLFNPRHYFYIHVDSRQEYLYRELLELEKKLPNVKLARNRLSTIWGGASLLQMLLQCMTDLINMKDWKWDYIINLSESDFPIKPLDQLEQFLAINMGRNFVKSHGQDTQRFIAKQALDKTFYECDTHMWRLGDRVLPWGIRVDGGSDWVALSHDFCMYVTQTDNELLRGLKTIFRHTLLPAESFFHTVLQNSNFCNTIVDNNLHVVNWKRKQGCKCQYRHIVDWCGCSPNVFKSEEWHRLQATEERPLFFARKFDPSINQQIIEQVERWIAGSHKSGSDQIGMNRYWQNEYHHKDRSGTSSDAKLTAYESLARAASKHLRGASHPCPAKMLHMQEATMYFDNDVFRGILVLFEAEVEGVPAPVTVEAQLRPWQHYVIHRAVGPTGRLKFLQVGSDFDLKEQVFRNFGRILGPFSEPGAVHHWGPGQDLSITFVWVDPVQVVAGSYEVKVESGNQILYHKPTFRQPLRPGVWTLFLFYEWILVAETKFLITPLAYNNGHTISSSQVRFLHNGPGQPYIDHDLSKVEAHLGYTNRSNLVRQALSNSKRFGKDLLEWTDSLTGQFWTVQDICFLSQPQHPTGGAFCYNLDLDPCHFTTWSSRSSDPKSEIKSYNSVHR